MSIANWYLLSLVLSFISGFYFLLLDEYIDSTGLTRIIMLSVIPVVNLACAVMFTLAICHHIFGEKLYDFLEKHKNDKDKK